jgi:hypothetical protein
MSEQSRSLPPEALDDWAAALRERLGLAADDVPVAAVLDLTKVVANNVARPAAPLGAFAAGLAAGRAGTDPADVLAALREVADLADGWEQ